MNKIYKLVWSKVRSAWVVTSEIAKGHGKDSSSGRNRSMLKAGVVMALLGGFMTAGISPVAAELTQDQQAVYDAVMAKLNEDGVNKIHYLSIGPDNEKNLAQDGNYNNDGVEQHWGIAIGVNASSKDGDGIAMGKDARSRGYESIGLGSLSSAVGDYSTATGHKSQAFGDSASAFGALARAYGANGVAIGGGALVANGKALTKAEYDALSEEEKALYHTEKTQQDKFYQYKQKNSSGAMEDIEVNGVAIGNFAQSIGMGGVAIGDRAKASDKDNVENSKWGVALGAYSQNKVSQGVALGTLSVADREKGAMAYLPTTGTVATGLEEAMQVAGKAEEFKQLKKDYEAANAELNEAKAAYEANTADDTLKATFEEAKKKVENLEGQYAVMTAPWTSQKGAVSIGNDKTGFTRQITGVAAGSEDTDAVNVAQLKVVNTKVDKNMQSITDLTTKVDGNTNNITNINQKIEKLTGSSAWTLAVARGDDSTTASEATAEGDSTKVSGGTVTFKAGRGIKLKQDGTNVQIGLKFIDMDPAGHPFNDAQAKGGGSLAVGQNSVAGAHQATAVGLDTEADEYGVALGTTSRAGKSAVAIGSRALADGTDSIAIGTAKRKVENDPTQGYRKVDSDYAIAIGGDAAVGEKSDASSAVGYSAEIAQSEWSNAFGGFSKIENSKYASTFGTASKVENAAYGTALGGYSKVQGAVYGTALGTSSRVQGAAYGTALGSNAAVIGAEGGVAIGADSVAERKASMIGYNPVGDQWNNLKDYLEKTGQTDAFKQATAKVQAAYQAWQEDQDNPELRANYYQARAEQSKIVSTWMGLQGAVSIGNEQEGFTRQLTGLAAGTEDTDAVNVAQLKALNTKVDNGAIHYVSVTAIDKSQTAESNYFNDGAKGDGGIAIGQGATSQGRGIAMGYKSSATPVGATLNLNSFTGIAIGEEANMGVPGGIAIGLRSNVEGTLNKQDGNVNEQGTVALGTDAYANGNGAAAFGWQAKGIGEGAMAFGQETKAGMAGAAFGGHANAAAGSVAMGWQANAHNSWATSIGTSSDAKGESSTALGGATTAVEKGSVALGADAVANTKAGAVGYIATGGSATFEEALATLDKKEDYDKWTATVNASKAEYDRLTKVFNSISEEESKKDEKAEAKKALDKWKTEHADFVEALAEKEKLEATWKATEGAVSVGADADNKAGNRVIKSRQITNVAAGTQDTDAVNVAQLKVVNAKTDKNAEAITNLTNTVNANGKATKVTVNNKEDNSDDANANLKITKNTVKGQTTYDLSLNDNITIGKDGKDGKIGINGKDGKSAEITVGKGEAGVDGKDGITRIIYTDKDKKTHEVATLDDGLKFKGDSGDVVIRKLNTQLDIKGGADAADLSDGNIGVVGTAGDQGGMEVKLSKNLKGLTSAEFKDGDNITNITGGNVTITRKEGNTTTKVDLWELNKTVNNITTGTTDLSSWKLQANGASERVIKKDSIVNFKNGTNTEVTVNGNDITVDLNKATKDKIDKIDKIDGRVTTIENKVNNIDTKIDQKIEDAKITVDGDTDTGVKATAIEDKGKVKGYKVSLDKKVTVGNVAIDGKDGKGEITGLTNKDWDGENIVSGRAATEDQLQKAMGKVQAQSRTTVKGSGNITVTPGTAGASEYTVGLAKDISVDSVTAKEYKVGDKTYINKDGINANGSKITNVADGTVSADSTDAVNGKQLYEVSRQIEKSAMGNVQKELSEMGDKVNEVRDESREGDAMNAAIAALKPLDFDPYNRSQVMAGVSTYKGKQAVAVGLAHYSNEDTLVHAGIAYGGSSDLMANAGISWRFGDKDDRDARAKRAERMPQYADGPISSVYVMQDEIATLRAENQSLKEENQEIKKQVEMLIKHAGLNA